LALACLVGLSLAPQTAFATTFPTTPLDLVDLLQQSQLIVRGRVTSVNDGVDARGIPYTEVTLAVGSVLKGQAGATYTFRQFGLLKPRPAGSGRVNLMVTPAAWATWVTGEESIAFLRTPARWTGLQTTAGLAQGQFKVSVGGALNAVSNSGLFSTVAVDPGLLGDREKRVLATREGSVNAEGFTSLVRQAVEGRWVETGRMRHAKH
jgi:hypothetical protein